MARSKQKDFLCFLASNHEPRGLIVPPIEMIVLRGPVIPNGDADGSGNSISDDTKEE